MTVDSLQSLAILFAAIGGMIQQLEIRDLKKKVGK